MHDQRVTNLCHAFTASLIPGVLSVLPAAFALLMGGDALLPHDFGPGPFNVE